MTGHRRVLAAEGQPAGRPAPGRAGAPRPGQAAEVDDVDRVLERTIDALLDQRRVGATICPSEAARAVDPVAWRDLMPAARAAAGRLAATGDVEVTQHGEVVDVATARGPVRIRRAAGPSVDGAAAEGAGDLP